MALRELDVRQKLDGFAKEDIIDRRACCGIARRTDSIDRSPANDIQHANEEEHGDEHAEQNQAGVNRDLHLVVSWQFFLRLNPHRGKPGSLRASGRSEVVMHPSFPLLSCPCFQTTTSQPSRRSIRTIV